MRRLVYGALCAGVLAVALARAVASSDSDIRLSRQGVQPRESARSSPAGRIGFGSGARLDEHFAKHGAEFGRITEEEYLRAAQNLRDRPAGGSVLEIVRDDGTVSRFDRTSGAFLAFNSDRTIRTFFKPNDGESYFRRQAQRPH